MATKSKAAPPRAVAPDPRTAAAAREKTPPPAGPSPEHQVTSEQKKAAADAPKRAKTELVSVTVHKPFNLHDDQGVLHRYPEIGVQDMPRSHATHWYALAHGVELNED